MHFPMLVVLGVQSKEKERMWWTNYEINLKVSRITLLGEDSIATPL